MHKKFLLRMDCFWIYVGSIKVIESHVTKPVCTKQCEIQTISQFHTLESILNHIGLKSSARMHGLIGEADVDGNKIR